MEALILALIIGVFFSVLLAMASAPANSQANSQLQVPTRPATPAERVAQSLDIPEPLKKPIIDDIQLLLDDAATNPANDPKAVNDEIMKALEQFLSGLRTYTPPAHSHLTTRVIDVLSPPVLIPLLYGQRLFPKYDRSFWNSYESFWENKPFTSLEDRLDCWRPPELPLGDLYYRNIPYVLPLDERGTGTWICCPPGTGKTNLMHGLIYDDIERVAAGEASLVIVDSKAHKAESLIDPWLNVDFETLDPRLKGRVYLFDPEIHPAINIFDLGAVDPLISLFRYMFTSLVEGMTLTGYQSTLLIKCIHAVKANPNPSVLDLYDILSNGWHKYEQGIRKLRPNHRDFFLKLRPDARNSKRMVCDFDSSTYFEQRTQVRARLDNLLSSVDLLYDTLASTETKINVPQLLDQGSIILIPAKTDVLGDAGSELYQRMWTMLILDAARKRKKGKEHPVFTYIDEAHKGIARDTRFSDTLDECRSAGIALTVAHPRRGNIKDADVLDALMEDCRIHFTSAGQKGVFNCRIGPTERVVRSKLAQIDHLPQLSKRRQAERLERMRALYGVGIAAPKPPPTPDIEMEPPPSTWRKPEGPTIDVDWEDITPSSGEQKFLPHKKNRRHDPTEPE